MNRKIIIILFFALLTTFAACTKKNNDIASPYYMQFKYDGADYKMTYCTFIQVNTKYYLQALASNQNLLSITTYVDLQPGQTYDMFTTTPGNYANFEISLNIGIESYQTAQSPAPAEKVGELTITQKTNTYISGTFFCKLNIGNITEGKFTAKSN